MPVVDPGMSVDPESLGAQFLRGATEQDNFESSVWEDPQADAAGFDQTVSQATVEIEEDDADVPESRSLIHVATAEAEEPADEVDLLSSSIREASLFDRPTLRGGTRSPRVHADESSGLCARNQGARDKAKREARARLRMQHSSRS